MISQSDTDMIHKYLESDLDAEEILVFTEKFNSVPEFAKEVKRYTDIRIALKSASFLRIKQWGTGRLVQHPGSYPFAASLPAASAMKRPASIYRSSPKFLMAAIITLIIGLGIIITWQLTNKPIQQQLYTAYYKNPFDTGQDLTARSPDLTADIYAFEKFKQAIGYMEQKRFGKAIELLESLTIVENSTLMDEIEWYLALSYLRSGKKEKAIDLFIQILNSNSIHSNSARSIYNELAAD